MVIEFLPMGPQAVLVVGLDDPTQWSLDVRAALAAEGRSGGHSGVVDVVPAAETVLVTFGDAGSLAAAMPTMMAVPSVPGMRDHIHERGVAVEIEVAYDGADLDDVARQTDLSTAEVVTLHSGAVYTAAFCGFAPGFAYLSGLPAALHLPRRATPRPTVPGGSVGIASEYSAVYPRASPGGWHLIGHTDTVMFDASRADPALLAPGSTVRFVPR